MPRWNKKHLPSWIACNGPDRQKMIDWLNFGLNSSRYDPIIEQLLADQESWTPEKDEEFLEWVTSDGFAIRAAEDGDIEPLRKKYPHLARYLQLPKRSGKGDRFPRPRPMSDYQERTLLAASDVGRIRRFWKEAYGKKNRPHGQIGAEEIAANRWNVSVDDVIRWIKKKGTS